jgi:hypothetical protein
MSADSHELLVILTNSCFLQRQDRKSRKTLAGAGSLTIKESLPFVENLA